MAESKLSGTTALILIVIVVIVAGIGAGLLYHFTHPGPAAAGQRVVVGDNVTVNYIGQFGSGPQTGRVFDTSILSVATNNASYPKSLSFKWRGADSDYVPLGVTVGPNIPSSGYTIDNITFGGVVTGFWQGLLGLPVNVTKIVSIPPSLGYGSANPSCFVTMPMVLTTPVVFSVPVANFTTDYPNATLAIGTEFTAQPYNWTAIVLNTNATGVTIEALPYVGQAITYGGLPYLVSALNSTTVTLQSQLEPANAGLILGHSAASVCDTTTYTVSAVSVSTGTFTADYNSEVVGQTLVFTVTVTQFY